jgi:hypothetical protein
MGALKAASVCGISKRGEITRHVVRERRPPFSDFGPARRRDNSPWTRKFLSRLATRDNRG